ncbi:MAG: hypothetical protein U0807_07635 [Candidatus Binatia bacterium]
MKEDFLAVVQAKRFLGREFLTWLVHRIEDGDGRFPIEGDVIEVALGDRVVLAGGEGDKETLTVVGAGDVGAEIGAGLRRGKLIDKARFTVTRGERRWELVLDGGMFTYDGLRCPALGDRDPQGDARAAFENDLFLRLADVDEAIGFMDGLFAEFCRVRGDRTWRTRELPALRAWVDGLR